MKGVVAIVGRPNVGKSTLFNKLVGRRVSITLREAGITRDRIYKEAHWRGKDFILVDTGGMVPFTSNSLLLAIKRQVEAAISEADLILFLVDAKEGLSPLDEEIMDSLRGRDFLLVANKMDAKKAQENLPEFYKLGVDKVFPISAEHGDGVAELLDEIMRRLPVGLKSEEEEVTRFVILGRPNVGKSSLLNTLLGEERVIVDEKPGTTRDAIETPFNFKDKRYIIVDTAGIRRKARVEREVEYFSIIRAIRNIESSNVALLMIDAQEGITFQDKKIANLVEEKGKGIVVVANKIDLLSKRERETLRDEFLMRAPFLSYAPLVMTSVVKREGIEEVMRAVEMVFSEAKKRMGKRILKDTILPEIGRHPSVIRISSISQIGITPPRFLIRVDRPEKVRRGFLKFIKNTLRNYFGFRGNPILIEYKS